MKSLPHIKAINWADLGELMIKKGLKRSARPLSHRYGLGKGVIKAEDIRPITESGARGDFKVFSWSSGTQVKKFLGTPMIGNFLITHIFDPNGRKYLPIGDHILPWEIKGTVSCHWVKLMPKTK